MVHETTSKPAAFKSLIPSSKVEFSIFKISFLYFKCVLQSFTFQDVSMSCGRGECGCWLEPEQQTINQLTIWNRDGSDKLNLAWFCWGSCSFCHRAGDQSSGCEQRWTGNSKQAQYDVGTTTLLFSPISTSLIRPRDISSPITQFHPSVGKKCFKRSRGFTFTSSVHAKLR